MAALARCSGKTVSLFACQARLLSVNVAKNALVGKKDANDVKSIQEPEVGVSDNVKS